MNSLSNFEMNYQLMQTNMRQQRKCEQSGVHKSFMK